MGDKDIKHSKVGERVAKREDEGVEKIVCAFDYELLLLLLLEAFQMQYERSCRMGDTRYLSSNS